MFAACPKCKGQMIPGKLTRPEKYLVGFKAEKQGLMSPQSYVREATACAACGYLELYLDTKELARVVEKARPDSSPPPIPAE